MAERPSKADLLSEVTQAIEKRATIAGGLIPGIDHLSILFPTLVLGQGAEKNKYLQNMRAEGGLAIVVATSDPSIHSSRLTIEAQIRPDNVVGSFSYTRSYSTHSDNLFLNVARVLPNWHSAVVLPVPAQKGKDSFVLSGVNDLKNPPGIVLQLASFSEDTNTIYLGKKLVTEAEDVIIMIENSRERRLYVGPFTLSERWREVVKNGRLISPEEIIEETDPQKPSEDLLQTARRIVDMPHETFAGFWGEIKALPTRSRTVVGQKDPLETKQAVLPVKNTQVPVDIRLLPEGEVELKLRRFSLREFVRQCGAGTYNIMACFPADRNGKETLNITLSVESNPLSQESSILVKPSVTRMDEATLQEINAWRYHTRHQETLDKRMQDLHDVLNNPQFLASLFENLQAAEAEPEEPEPNRYSQQRPFVTGQRKPFRWGKPLSKKEERSRKKRQEENHRTMAAFDKLEAERKRGLGNY